MSFIDKINWQDIQDLGSKELTQYDNDTTKYAIALGEKVADELGKDGFNLDEEQIVNIAIDVVAGVVAVACPPAGAIIAGIGVLIRKFHVVNKVVHKINDWNGNEIANLTPEERLNFIKLYTHVMIKAGDFSGGQSIAKNWMWKLYDVTGGRWSKSKFWGIDGGKPNHKVVNEVNYRRMAFQQVGLADNKVPNYVADLAGSETFDGVASDILNNYKSGNLDISNWTGEDKGSVSVKKLASLGLLSSALIYGLNKI